MNYLLLNGFVLVVVLIVCYLFLKQSGEVKRSRKPFWTTLAIVIGLTAIFDSLIIAANIVAYDTNRILGIYIGKAPLEDFVYAIVSVIIVITLWEYYEHKE